MDNLSHCKSFKKMKKKDRKKEKKVKMLLCTPPSSPVPHPNYFYIRCVHCDIPFPFSFYNDLHNVGPTFHICKIPRFHILWPCKFSWDAGERPCNARSHKLCWSKAFLVLKWNFSIQYLEYSQILMLERTSTNCNISY